MQDAFDSDGSNGIKYDQFCLTSAIAILDKVNVGYKYEPVNNGVFDDTERARELVTAILEDCDSDCIESGTHWSHVFVVNAVILMLLGINMICIIAGTYKALWR